MWKLKKKALNITLMMWSYTRIDSHFVSIWATIESLPLGCNVVQVQTYLKIDIKCNDDIRDDAIMNSILEMYSIAQFLFNRLKYLV